MIQRSENIAIEILQEALHPRYSHLASNGLEIYNNFLLNIVYHLTEVNDVIRLFGVLFKPD